MIKRPMDEPSICFISPSVYGYFNPERTTATGGAQRQLYLIGNEISKRFEVKFVVGDFGQSDVEKQNEITLFKSYKPSPNDKIAGRLQDLKKLWVAMKRANADIYITRGIGSGRAAFDYLFTRFIGKRWIFNSVNEPGVHEQLLLPLRTILTQGIKNSTVICQTDLDAKILGAHYGIDPEVVYNGYPSVDSVCGHENREYFLWVGRINKTQKRPHLYLDLAKELPEHRFLLIGPLDDCDAYTNKIESRSESLDNVEYIGEVDPNEIHEYYKRAIALVSTSSSEGFPNVFLEAWRYSTPVLSLDIDMYEKVGIEFPGYADGEFWKIVEFGKKISSDEERLREWGECSRFKFEQNFTIKRVASRYVGAALE